MTTKLYDYWHPVARAATVGKTPVAVELLEQRIVLFRVGEKVVALKDLCAHRGTPLSLGWIEGDTITCAYHGWKYNSQGSCVKIPSLQPGGRIPSQAKIPEYRTQIKYGLIWVALGTPKAPIPNYPSYADETVATVLYDDFRWQANAARVIENALDYTHLPWVHEGLLGSRADAVFPDCEATPHDDGLRIIVEDDRNQTRRQYNLSLPFTLELQVQPWESSDPSDLERKSPKGRKYSMLFTCCPVSTTETIQWFFTSRDWSLTQPDEDWYAFDAQVMAQDQIIVEHQRPEELPLDLTAELHLRGTDSGALMYRRLLRDIGVEWS